MTIMEAIRLPALKGSEHDRSSDQISPESTSVEWMRHMRKLRDQTLQADIALENNKSDNAMTAYLDNIESIDSELGQATDTVVDYIKKYGARTYDEKGKALDMTSDVLAPLEIGVLEDALTIYEHIRTDNSQALLEALLIKYGDERFWKNSTVKERYEALSGLTSDTITS